MIVNTIANKLTIKNVVEAALLVFTPLDSLHTIANKLTIKNIVLAALLVFTPLDSLHTIANKLTIKNIVLAALLVFTVVRAGLIMCFLISNLKSCNLEILINGISRI